MIRRTCVSLIVLMALGFGWSFVQGEPDRLRTKKGDNESALMRAKLSSSQKIVEGLVSKDFATISHGAEELLKICNGEEWERHRDEIYSHYRKELIRQTEKIVLASEHGNLDGAAYSYVHSLTTCISCHDYCRDVLKIAENTGKFKVVPIPTTAEADNSPPASRTIRR